MIRAEELRIGNLVYFNGRYKEIGKVTAIAMYESRHVNVSLNGMRDISYTLKEISTIELTEEILLECGFIKSKNSSELKYYLPIPILNCEIHATFFLNQFVVELLNHLVPIVTEVEYLHQLQNLYFALTGQELPINIKKNQY